MLDPKGGLKRIRETLNREQKNAFRVQPLTQ